MPWYVLGLALRDDREAVLALSQDWRSFVASVAVLGSLALAVQMALAFDSYRPYVAPIVAYPKSIWISGEAAAPQTWLTDFGMAVGKSSCALSVFACCAAIGARATALGAVLANHGTRTLQVYLLHFDVLKHFEDTIASLGYIEMLAFSFLVNWVLSSWPVHCLMLPLISPRMVLASLIEAARHFTGGGAGVDRGVSQ